LVLLCLDKNKTKTYKLSLSTVFGVEGIIK
jgi:hypothetical protein